MPKVPKAKNPVAELNALAGFGKTPHGRRFHLNGKKFVAIG
jgi:hypothetical protein